MIISLNISTSVQASSYSTTSYSTTVTYNKSEDAIYYGNTYLGEEFEYFESGHYPDDYTSADSNTNRFYYQGKRQQLFTSNANYYGYAITVTRSTKTTLTYDNTMKEYWVVGSATDLLNGQNVGGLIDASSFTVWVPTENSVQSIHMAPFFLFSVVSFVHDGLVSDVEAGSYAINCKYTVKYVGYKTKAEYESAMNDIKTELESQTGQLEEQTEQIKEQTETQKGIFSSIKEFFAGFFDNLTNSIIGIFVPSSEEMSELFNQLNDFFSDTFGFLYFPFEFIVKFLTVFVDSASFDSGAHYLTFPGFSIMGIQVWQPIKFGLLEYPVISTIFTYVRTVTGIILSVAFVNYLRSFFDKRFGGGGG